MTATGLLEMNADRRLELKNKISVHLKGLLKYDLSIVECGTIQWLDVVASTGKSTFY